MAPEDSRLPSHSASSPLATFSAPLPAPLTVPPPAPLPATSPVPLPEPLPAALPVPPPAALPLPQPLPALLPALLLGSRPALAVALPESVAALGVALLPSRPALSAAAAATAARSPRGPVTPTPLPEATALATAFAPILGSNGVRLRLRAAASATLPRGASHLLGIEEPQARDFPGLGTGVAAAWPDNLPGNDGTTTAFSFCRPRTKASAEGSIWPIAPITKSSLPRALPPLPGSLTNNERSFSSSAGLRIFMPSSTSSVSWYSALTFAIFAMSAR
mmetsp:Transcript_21635/g.47852  ORF Transcript_21635/g.47852 Transcript_21635/m.47852 type:complete len:276 (-) Transcript_21635:698-1525(-)